MQKTVYIVEFGCSLVSEPMEASLAEMLKEKLGAKGLQCYTRDVFEEKERRVIFTVGQHVFFRQPVQGDKYAPNLSGYIHAAGRNGPFLVLGEAMSRNPETHPQILMLGEIAGQPIKVQYGEAALEPLEVSGYWLTAEAW